MRGHPRPDLRLGEVFGLIRFLGVGLRAVESGDLVAFGFDLGLPVVEVRGGFDGDVALKDEEDLGAKRQAKQEREKEFHGEGSMITHATVDVSVASEDVIVNEVPGVRAVTPTAAGLRIVPRV